MIKKLLFILLVFMSCKSAAQEDGQKIFDDKVNELAGDISSSDSLFVAFARSFIGTPYVAKTLEGESEELVVNFEGLDCTTFIETSLAMSKSSKANEINFEAYKNALEFIRYRSGKRNDYTSRLHYFSEWIIDNEKKGIIKNLSSEYGQALDKEINFMSTHPQAYQQLVDSSALNKIIAVEKSINQHDLYFIHKFKLKEVIPMIKSGDILAFTSSVKGLDVSHAGIAIIKDGEVHVLHASLKNGVIISEENLEEFLQPKRYTGLMIARLAF